MARIKLIGYDQVKKDYVEFLKSGDITLTQYLDFIGDRAIQLLSANTPRDTGELASSWQIISRDATSITIGVSDDQEDALYYTIFGAPPSPGHFVPALGVRVFKRKDGSDVTAMHPGNVKNDFVFRIQGELNQLMALTMKTTMMRGHKFYKGFDSPSDNANLLKIVGLTGLKGNKRRGLGRTSFNVRTGRKSLKVRIGRRRRVTATNYIKSVKLG
jgi:hypothetical protein